MIALTDYPMMQDSRRMRRHSKISGGRVGRSAVEIYEDVPAGLQRDHGTLMDEHIPKVEATISYQTTLRRESLLGKPPMRRQSSSTRAQQKSSASALARPMGAIAEDPTLTLSSEHDQPLAKCHTSLLAQQRLQLSSPQHAADDDVALRLAHGKITGLTESLGPRRTSLAMPPRRHVLKPVQSLSFTNTEGAQVRPGSGLGKENIPPHWYANGNEDTSDAKLPGELIAVEGTVKARNSISPPLFEEQMKRRSHKARQSISLSGSSLVQKPARRRSMMPQALHTESAQRPQTICKHGAEPNFKRQKLNTVRSIEVSVSWLENHRSEELDMSKRDPSHQDQAEAALKKLESSVLAHSFNFFIKQKLPNYDTDSENLRQRLAKSYSCPGEMLAESRISACLKYGCLQASEACMARIYRLKSDTVQQVQFLRVFQSTYAPKLLSLALDTIICDRNTTARHARSGDTELSKRNATSLMKHLIEHDDIQRNGSMLNEGQRVFAWELTILRSLRLIRLLDVAKRDFAIEEPLFQKSSPCKDSVGVLRALGKLMMPNIRDLSQILAQLDFRLEYIQSPLRELQPWFNDLLEDSRNMVKLAILTTCLSHQTDLERSAVEVMMRELEASYIYPCADQEQRTHNIRQWRSIPLVARSRPSLLHSNDEALVASGDHQSIMSLLWRVHDILLTPVVLDDRILRTETRRLTARALSLGAAAIGTISFQTPSPGHEPTQGLEAWLRAVCASRGHHIETICALVTDERVMQSLIDTYGELGVPGLKLHARQQRVHKLLECQFGYSVKGASFLQAFGTSERTRNIAKAILVRIVTGVVATEVPVLAARSIQSAWRAFTERQSIKRRVRLARLAHECAKVVAAQRQILWAVYVIQRSWRRCLNRAGSSQLEREVERALDVKPTLRM